MIMATFLTLWLVKGDQKKNAPAELDFCISDVHGA
jgi:hypothetical protein